MVKIKHKLSYSSIDKFFYEEGGIELICSKCKMVLYRQDENSLIPLWEVHTDHKKVCTGEMKLVVEQIKQS